MNGRIILASLAGAVASFVLGWVVYDTVLAKFYTTNSNHIEGLWVYPPNLVGLFFSTWAYSLMLALIFGKWANISRFVPGLVAGACISFLIALNLQLYFWSSTNLFDDKLIVVNVLVATVFNGLIGGIIAFILGFKRKEA